MMMVSLGAGDAAALSTSPGPLARSHSKLEGKGKCTKCHTPQKGVTDDKCLDCHKEAKQSKYHWKMTRASGKPCAKCHRDHRGRDFRMIRWRPEAHFDHRKTGFKLVGKHTKLQCANCHKKPGRWMGLQQACKSCHTDPHKPTLGGDCKSCHIEKAFAPATRFNHDKAKFKLRGKHKDVACKDCHKGTGTKGKYRGLKFAACNDCHSEPVKNHSRGIDCKDCHTIKGFDKVTRAAAMRLHKKLALPLRHSHEKLACEKCHTKRKKKAATPAKRLAAFTGLKATCGSCHKDAHKKRLGDKCAECHKETRFRDIDSKRFNHKLTGFRLRGRHRRIKCTKCHAPSGDYEYRFRATRGEKCTDCHYDPHGDFKSVKGGDTCETCHSESGFAPASFDLDSHKQTRFALRYAHRVVPCGACHPKTERADDDKKTIAQLIGIDSRCTGCHGRPHGGQFDRRKPSLECWECHQETKFADLQFNHQASRFPLQGAHKDAKCSQCHTRPGHTLAAAKQAADDPGPVRFTGTSKLCADCHSDPHARQFRSNGPEKTCSDCHTVRKGFSIESFDHAKKTRFSLAGKHAQVDCKSCHRPVAIQGTSGKAEKVVVYRLGQAACETCHFNPHADKK